MKPPFLSTSFSEPAKNAKRRFSNIFGAHKKRRGFFPFCIALTVCAAGGLCASCTAGSVGIIGGADGPTAIFVTDGKSSLEKLYSLRTKYIGGAPAVGKIIGAIPYIRYTDGMELYTSDEPYGVGVYTYLDEISEQEADVFRRAGAVLISLIDNCNTVKYVNRESGAVLCETTRAEWDAQLAKSLAQYAESYESFAELYSLLLDGAADETDRFGEIIFAQEGDGSKFYPGECAGEGHVILKAENYDDKDVYYMLTTYGEYGFENGRLVKVSGTGVIPVRLTLAKDGSVIEYRVPQDGSYYLPTLKEMFPPEYVKMDFSKYYNSCIEQEERYARAYLASINRRDAKVGYGTDAERDSLYRLADMSVDASNDLLDLYAEYPYWIGTLELIEDGVRYVYEKSWDSRGGGNGTVTYHKYRYDNSQTVEKTVIDVTNDKMTCIEGTLRTTRLGM